MMNSEDRENLIRSLAREVGLEDITASKYNGAHYDESTGTFYCEGIALPHSSIDRIKSWYKTQMERTKDLAARDNSVMEQYMRYALAYNAISLLKDNMED